jgi:hypothetical protein
MSDMPASEVVRPAVQLGMLYRRGVLMHLGNPKAVLAWVAIMSLGLKPGASLEMAVTAFGGCVLLGILIFAGYAVLFSTRTDGARLYACATMDRGKSRRLLRGRRIPPAVLTLTEFSGSHHVCRFSVSWSFGLSANARRSGRPGRHRSPLPLARTPV